MTTSESAPSEHRIDETTVFDAVVLLSGESIHKRGPWRLGRTVGDLAYAGSLVVTNGPEVIPWHQVKTLLRDVPVPEGVRARDSKLSPQQFPPTTKACCCTTINYHGSGKCKGKDEVAGYCRSCYKRCLPEDASE